MVAPAGIEPATLGLEVLCSDPTELRGHVLVFFGLTKSANANFCRPSQTTPFVFTLNLASFGPSVNAVNTFCTDSL